MDYRSLGTLRVSAVGLGCNNFGARLDAEQTRRVVDAAIGAGITYFDTAEMYGNGQSEEFLGAALNDRRDQVVIATKWGHPNGLAEGQRGGDPALIRRSLEASLRRLGTDYVDHYQLHQADSETPPEETLSCLAELRQEGKVREIGVSNASAEYLRKAHAAGERIGAPPWASVQNRYSLLWRQPEHDGVFDACDELGIAFVPFFPLEAGLLTGKVRRNAPLPESSRLAKMGDRVSNFVDDSKLDIVERLIAWTAERDRTLLELALSWNTSNPLIASVIAGATSPEQVAANVAAAGWAITNEERAELDALIGEDDGD